MTLHRLLRVPLLIVWLCSASGGGCSRGQADVVMPSVAKSGTKTLYATEIRQPPVPRGVETNVVNPHGQQVTLQCAACHGVRPARVVTSQSAELDEFHQGLKMAHGQLTCVSCHQTSDGYSTLKLADGRSIAFAESMMLCAQCHGPQFRDYQKGSHGGMTGHWDLTRGGRTRNHCLHCHDPHSPKFPIFAPAAPPRDRFPPATIGVAHE